MSIAANIISRTHSGNSSVNLENGDEISPPSWTVTHTDGNITASANGKTVTVTTKYGSKNVLSKVSRGTGSTECGIAARRVADNQQTRVSQGISRRRRAAIAAAAAAAAAE